MCFSIVICEQKTQLTNATQVGYTYGKQWGGYIRVFMNTKTFSEIFQDLLSTNEKKDL